MNTAARTTFTALGFLLIAAFFLTTEHRAHVYGSLPFLILLACPLLHMFGHGGHNGHGAHGDQDTSGGARQYGAAPAPIPHAGHDRSAGRKP